MQALTDHIVAAAPSSDPSLDTVRVEHREPVRQLPASRGDRALRLEAGSVLRTQLRAALNDLADEMFQSLEARSESRRPLPATSAMPQEQAVHLRAALAAADQSHSSSSASDQGEAGDGGRTSQPLTQQWQVDERHAEDVVRQLNDQLNLMTRVLHQVTERCESSELEVQRLQAAVRQAEQQRGQDTARIDALTHECQSLSATHEWTRARLDEVETAASANAAQQARELAKAHATQHSLITSLERETRRASALEDELASARQRLESQAQQLASLGSAYNGLQQLLTRIMGEVNDAGDRLQRLVEHQAARFDALDV